MSTPHLEVLVEEHSMEVFLAELLPRLLGPRTAFTIHAHQGKSDLLAKLAPRLRAYAKWLPATWRIVVVVDRDRDDCRELKQRLESWSAAAGLLTAWTCGQSSWKIVNRIAVEELEAWYFGDWKAVRQAYPRVAEGIPRQEAYRDPDATIGGTWEALERILQRAGYFAGGLRKTEIARAVARQMDPASNTSRSFRVFRDAISQVAI